MNIHVSHGCREVQDVAPPLAGEALKHLLAHVDAEAFAFLVSPLADGALPAQLIPCSLKSWQ